MSMNRGGNRGRGAFNNMGNRGPNQGSGSFRGHGGSHRGFANRDNRRGGGGGGGSSFNAGGPHGQPPPPQQQHGQGYGSSGGNTSSFRGRNHGFHHGGRKQDSGVPHGPKDTVSANPPAGKREENRRTLTDFKIIGLELRDLAWSWGIIPNTPAPEKPEW